MTSSLDIANCILKLHDEDELATSVLWVQLARDYLEAVEHLSKAAIAIHLPEVDDFLSRIGGDE